MKENENQHGAINQEMDDTFLRIRHTFAWHLPYFHLEHGWALKVGMQGQSMASHGTAMPDT